MITQERLKELLSYNETTGLFTRKVTAGSAKAGSIAGFKCKDGYFRLWIDNKRYSNHWLAWFYVNAAWPSDELDHIDGDRCNNRIKNLRESNRIENSRNRGKPISNSSGAKGVTWNKSVGKWQAQIGFNQTTMYLGCFETIKDASCAYEKKALELHGAFYRPNTFGE